MSKEWLFGKSADELSVIVTELGMPSFTAGQIATWLYKKGVTSIDKMTNISQSNRLLLSEKFEAGAIPPSSVAKSKDGTKKYLFETLEGQFIESAYIPDRERATLCVSSQAGCRMGCKFCMTGRQGLSHSLAAGEILNQINSIPERDKLTNVVYMGMGEPLDNTGQVLRSLEVLTSEWGYAWSPSRITLSTIGVIPAMKRFLIESKVHLAVSLHNPIPDQRREIMPVENKYPIREVIEELKRHDFSHQRRVSFEYIMLAGMNDRIVHINVLTRLLDGLKCRVNLIRFHAIADAPFQSSDEQTMEWFRDQLTARGIITTIRSSRGEDIQAACGLLSTMQSGK